MSERSDVEKGGLRKITSADELTPGELKKIKEWLDGRQTQRYEIMESFLAGNGIGLEVHCSDIPDTIAEYRAKICDDIV